MAIVYTDASILEVWKTVSIDLIDDNHKKNVLIEVSNPCNYANLEALISSYNPSLFTGNFGSDNIKNVINTIFPYKMAEKFPDRNEFYEHYKAIHNRARHLRNQKWGTYFSRLIDYPKSINGRISNQLENAINALKGNSSCKNYITFHLSSINIEANVRPMGAPCWQYGQIIINDNGSLNLLAVYRNHDYFKKSLGNFIGLSKLLEYICNETNREPNLLIIHSINAFYDVSKAKFRNLINGV